MIVSASTPDYGVQLFRNAFARLLSEAWEISVQEQAVAGWDGSRRDRGSRILGAPILIDGEWPRLVYLNQPLHPDFWKRRQRGFFSLQGQFRRFEFYIRQRERIRNDWFRFESDSTKPHRDVVVCAMLARLEGAEGRHYCLRPTPDELRDILPDLDFARVQVLSSPVISQGNLRPDYGATAARLVFADQAAMVAAARRARVVVANTMAHAWWSGFLSFAEEMILITYGGDDKYCQSCETALVGKPKLIFRDSTVRHVDLSLVTPDS